MHRALVFLLALLAHAGPTIAAQTEPEMVTLPTGQFTMGNDTEYSSPIASNQPAHKVKVKKFKIGKYEVTNAQYVDFLNEADVANDIEVRQDPPNSQDFFVFGNDGHPSEGRRLYHLSGTNQDGEDELNIPWIAYEADAPVGTRFMLLDSRAVFGHNRALDTADWPAAFVLWHGAAAFAYHHGLALPTEAQWEYAARGGMGYAFGTDDGTLSIENANYSGFTEPGGGEVVAEGAVGHATAVGSYPANPFGLHDLAGNVWEWTADLYDPDFYADSPKKDPVSTTGIDGTAEDPVLADGCKGGPSTPYDCNTRLKRGGSWNFHEDPIRSDARNTDYVFRGNDHFGFRVAGSTKKPRKPGKLKATSESDGTTTLTWVDKSNNEASFAIECQASGDAWERVANLYPNVESVELELEADTTYTCRIRSSNAKGESGWRKKRFRT